MSITDSIQEAIAKNLPQAVGTELQKVLAQGEKDAQAASHYKGQVESLEKDVRSLGDEVNRLRGLDLSNINIKPVKHSLNLLLLRKN